MIYKGFYGGTPQLPGFSSQIRIGGLSGEEAAPIRLRTESGIVPHDAIALAAAKIR